MVSNDVQGCIMLFTAAHIRTASIVWIPNKNILVQTLSSLIQSNEILQKQPWKKATASEISFSPWLFHLKMAFLPLRLKTFCLKICFSLGFCEVARSFFLLECGFLWGFGLHPQVHVIFLNLCVVSGWCVCVLCVYMHTYASIQVGAQIACLGAHVKVRGAPWVLVLAFHLVWVRLSSRSPLCLQEQLQLQGSLLCSLPILLEEP